MFGGHTKDRMFVRFLVGILLSCIHCMVQDQSSKMNPGCRRLKNNNYTFRDIRRTVTFIHYLLNGDVKDRLERRFYLGFTARQDYFTHFEPSQSVGGAKAGDPREKPPDHPQAELCLSHM